MLQSDSQGFLTGTTVDIRRAADQLSGIRADVAAIRRAILGSAPSGGTHGSRSSSGDSNPRPDRQHNSSGAGNPAVNRATRTVNPGAVSSVSPVIPVPGAVSSVSPVIPVVQNPAARTSPTRNASGQFTRNSANVVTPSGRDSAGRFTGGSSQSETNAQRSLLGSFADRIATAVGSTGDGLEEVDPAVKAVQEIAQPLQQGYQVFFGGGDKKERWYRRIFGELKLFRRDSSVFDRAQSRSLHNIENNPGGGGDGGGGAIGALFGSIAPLALTAIAGIGGVLLTGIGAVLGVIFSPIGLAIGAAAAVAWGLFTEDGQKFLGEIGAKIIAGWEVVTTAFEPISSYISAGWDTVTLAFEPITTSISESWDSVKSGFDSVVDGMLSSWNAFTGFLKDKFGIDIPAIFKPVADIGKKIIDGAKSGIDAVGEKASSLGNKANDFIKEKTGFNVKESVSNTASSIKGGIHSIADKATDGATKIASRATGKQSTNKAAMIAEMDAQGITDPKERAMLMAQVDHESGGFTYTKELGKDSYFDKYDAGTKIGKNLGNTEKGDGAKYKGRGLIQLTGRSNYEAAGKDLGLDLINHPELAETPENAAKTATWFWKKNKLSGKAQDGDVTAVTKRINGGTNGLAERKEKYSKYLAEGVPSQLASVASQKTEAPTAVAAKSDSAPAAVATTEGKGAEVNPVVTASKSGVSPSTPDPAAIAQAEAPGQASRYKYEALEGGKIQKTDNETGVMELASESESNDFRKKQGQPYLDQVAAINSMGTQSAHMPMPTSPKIPSAPAIQDSPGVVTPMGSGNSNKPIMVSMQGGDVGQDVTSRPIAHLATGGLSGRG